jgi:serine/threonine protein kinase
MRKEVVVSKCSRSLVRFRSLHHPNIVHLYGFFETPTSFNIVLELAFHGDVISYFRHLRKRGRRPDRTVIRRILAQTCRALAYLEQCQVAHRDIKPENIVITDSLEAKLADFGWAVWCRPHEWQTTFCGTVEYCPPEIARPGPLCYDPRFVDRWMLGVLIVELTTGSTPFNPKVDDDPTFNLMALQMIGSFRSVHQLALPREVMELVSELMVIEPHNRKSAEWALAHPFFDGVHHDTRHTASSPTVAPRRQFFENEGETVVV